MFSNVYSGTVFGMQSYIISVEADASSGLPGFEMVGLLNSEVKEAKERVKVSLKNNGFPMPPLKITINLSPANIRKSGTKFDLPIAIALLCALGEVKQKDTEGILFLGELGLDGELRFVQGVLPIVLEAKNNGFKKVVLPRANANEAASVEGMEIFGLDSLLEVIRFLSIDEEEKKNEFPAVKIDLNKLFEDSQYCYDCDFFEVNGQEELKRAAMIAAAGFHHMLIIGSPGSGKTMVAKRIPTILPPLSYEESVEVSKIYSVSGYIKEYESLIVRRPFNSPHHTISAQALAGGGSVPQPGIISLSHRGVLFLDEAVHFNRNVLEILRQPMEDKTISICRSSGKFEFPADFMLIAAINPCPCGYFPDRNKCRCTEPQIKSYLEKISGPILDRIDICVHAMRVEFSDLKESTQSKSSKEIRAEIIKARRIQEDRFRGTSLRFNGEMSPSDIRKYCILDEKDEKYLEKAFQKMELSARAYHKVLRIARTIADMDCCEKIERRHLAEALNYRMTQREFW